MLVNSSDLKKPPTKSTARTTLWGVPAVNSAMAARKKLLTTAFVTRMRLKPKRRRIGAAGAGKSEEAGLERGQAEAELEEQWQEKGKRAHADAVEKAAHDAGIEGI